MSTTAPTIPLGTGTKVVTMVVQTNANFVAAKLLPGTATNNSYFLNNIIRFLDTLCTGAWRSNMSVITGGVYATGTATLATVIATNTLVVGGVTLTCVNSGATAVQFNKGTTDTLTAVNLAAAINALTTINKVVQATSSGAVVTIACLIPGTIGNLVTLSQTGGTITVASTLTGGTDGSIGNISHGL